jgi:hypothetical protein
LIAFIASGRLSVISSTRPRRSVNTASFTSASLTPASFTSLTSVAS